MSLRALLGDHPATRALRTGQVTSPSLGLDFADVPTPNKAFKRVVREVEFDVAELALMTFLMARSRGVPLRLFPVVLFSRNPLPYLVCRAGPDRRQPRDLEGCRVGVRAYTTTTAVWVRALLADALAVDCDRVEWLTFEEGHVAGVPDPPNVRRDPAHADLVALLRERSIDAAIVDPVPADPGIVPVVRGADQVYEDWQRQTGARTINHVMVVRDEIADDAAAMAELFTLFRLSRDAAGVVDSASAPIGWAAMRRSLEVAIATATRQRLLAAPLTVDDLTTPVLASLA